MFQTNQITRLAVVVFKEEGQITISGEGMLKKMFLSAYLSEDRIRIQPPREHFYFNRNSHTGLDNALIRKVATYYILSESEAEAMVRSWESSIKQMAVEEGVRFGEYGTFHFEGQFDFVSESFSHYQWLPVLSYRSPGVEVEEYSLTDSVPVVHLANQKQKRNRRILIPALWGVFACLFVFALFFWSEPINLLFGQNHEMNTRLVNVAPQSYTVDEPLDYYSDTHEMDPVTSEPKKEFTNDLSGTEEIRPGHKPSDSVATLASEKDKKSTITEENQPAPTPRCTLVLGAFANPDNVNRMVSKLDDIGLEVITMERQTMTLVAAKVDCADQSGIDRLRDKIDPNAWVYKK